MLDDKLNVSSFQAALIGTLYGKEVYECQAMQ